MTNVCIFEYRNHMFSSEISKYTQPKIEWEGGGGLKISLLNNIFNKHKCLSLSKTRHSNHGMHAQNSIRILIQWKRSHFFSIIFTCHPKGTGDLPSWSSDHRRPEHHSRTAPAESSCGLPLQRNRNKINFTGLKFYFVLYLYLLLGFKISMMEVMIISNNIHVFWYLL